MVMLAEQYDFVIGGDPDRDTIDLAVVIAATGAVGGYHTDRADGPGYRRLLSWAVKHAPGRRAWCSRNGARCPRTASCVAARTA